MRKKEHIQTIEPDKLLFTSAALKALIIPLIIEQVLAVLVGMADAMMVSGTGEAALSAVSLVDMMNVIIINLFAALATGGSVVASQFIGAQKKDKACQSAGQLILVTSVLSSIIMVLTLIFKRQLVSLFFGSIEADVMTNALTYFTITAVSYPFIAVYSAANALFRAMGNSKITMKTALLMNLINIVGNAILIYGFQMGVAGAAYATLLARAVACILMLVLLGRSEGDISISLHQDWRPNFSMIQRILRIGVPNGFENTFFQLGRVLVLSIISYFGTTQIAANATANSLTSIACIPGHAIGLAMITIIGQCVGAQDLKQAVYYMKRLMKLTYILMFIVAVALMLLLTLILKLYHLSPETEWLAFVLVAIHAGFGIIFWPASFTLPNALRAANDVTFTMIVAVASMLIFRIASSYILGLWLGWGAIGVWLAMVMDWICRVVCFVSRVVSGAWKKKAAT
mgnify:FL=1